MLATSEFFQAISMILTEQNLMTTLRRLSDGVKKRFWIATPFLGGLKDIRRFIGRAWIDRKIDVRLLINTDNIGIDPVTVARFQDLGKVKHLPRLHAKIYIIDDIVIIGSANLTRAGMMRRREVAVLLGGRHAKNVSSIFDRWWKRLANEVPSGWRPRKLKGGSPNEESGYQPGTDLWSPLADPGDVVSFNANLAYHFADYENFLNIYRNFVRRFLGVQRLNRRIDPYLEVDGLLDFLYHKGRKLSKPYNKKKPRTLSRAMFNRRLASCARLFRNAVNNNVVELQWRMQAARTVRRLLNPRNVGTLRRPQIIAVLNCINAMTTGEFARYNRKKFLRENSAADIRAAWEYLLHGTGSPPSRMRACFNALSCFGYSSIQELFGYYHAQQYPLRNMAVNAGLRYFGYKINPY